VVGGNRTAGVLDMTPTEMKRHTPGYSGGDCFCMMPVDSVDDLVPLEFPNSEFVRVDENGNETRERKTFAEWAQFSCNLGGQEYVKLSLQNQTAVQFPEFESIAVHVSAVGCLDDKQYREMVKANQPEETV